jgi:hypothetical protein
MIGDEMRHHHAYSEFVSAIFKVDPSEMMIAFQYMMKQKMHRNDPESRSAPQIHLHCQRYRRDYGLTTARGLSNEITYE